MKIRRAGDADVDSIHATLSLFPDKVMLQHLPRTDEFFVAEDDAGAIVACCALEVYSVRLAEIRSLAVHPDHQGKGIGTLLIETCLKEAKEKKIHEVLTITGAGALFEKHGFSAFKSERFALLKVLE